MALLRAETLQRPHPGHVVADLDEARVAPVAAFVDLPRGTVQRLDQLHAVRAHQAGESSLAGFRRRHEHPAEPAVRAGEEGPVGKDAGLVVFHGVVTEDVPIEGHGLVHVRHAHHGAAHAAGEFSFVDVQEIRLDELEAVAVEVLDIEAGGAVRQGGNGGNGVPLGRKGLVAGGDVAAVEFRGEDAEIAHGDVEARRLRRPFRVLPDLESAAALQVHGDAGMAFLRLVARVGQHAFRHRVVLQDFHIGPEHLDEPVPGFPEVFRSDPDLLDAGNVESVRFVHRCIDFYSYKDNNFCVSLYVENKT